MNHFVTMPLRTIRKAGECIISGWKTFRRNIWVMFFTKTVLFFLLVIFTIIAIIRGIDDVLISFTPRAHCTQKWIYLEAVLHSVKPDNPEFLAGEFQWDKEAERRKKYYDRATEEGKKEYLLKWQDDSCRVWLKLAGFIFLWFVLFYLFSFRFRKYIKNNRRQAIFLGVYGIAGMILFVGVVGAIFTQWLPIQFQVISTWYFLLNVIRNFYAQWWAKAFLSAGCLSILPTLYHLTESEQQQCEEAERRNSVAKLFSKNDANKEKSYDNNAKYRKFAREAANWNGDVPGYLSCPDCGKKVKIHERWTCDCCKQKQSVDRLITDCCEHCGKKLKKVYCEHCHQELEL